MFYPCPAPLTPRVEGSSRGMDRTSIADRRPPRAGYYLTAFADRFLVVSKESIMTPQGGLGGCRGMPPGLFFSQQ